MRARSTPAPADDPIAAARARRDNLEQRLTDGWRLIDDAIAAGTDTAAWEDAWIALLHQYERACDLLAALEGPRQASLAQMPEVKRERR